MKNKSTYLWWLAAVLLPWIWLWPSFANPSFSMIDDGIDLSRFRMMDSDFWGWLHHGESSSGRFRPLYWILRYALYYAPFGLNVEAWYGMHYAVLVAILTMTFILLKKIAGKAPVAFLGCAVWIINPKTMENFTRFATAEVWQLLWSAAAMLCLLELTAGSPDSKKKIRCYILLFLSTACLYLSKETSVFFFPVSVIFLFGSLLTGKKRAVMSSWMLINLALFVLQRKLSPPMSGYSSAFTFSVTTIVENLHRYPGRIQWLYVLLLSLATFFYRTLGRPKMFRKVLAEDPRNAWQWGTLITGCAFVATLLPWAYATPRYLVYPEYFFSIFMALELSILLETLSAKLAQWPLGEETSRKRLGITVRGIFFAVVFLLAFFSQAELGLQLRYAYGLAGKETPVQTLKIFAQKANPNAKVLYLEMEDELLAAAAIYLRDIYGRKDITLYSFSPFAAERQKSGLPIVPVKQEDWPNILEKMDYLYWPHRGYSKIGLEILHTQMIQGLVFSGVQYYLDPFYENVLYPIRNLPPEGAQIWSVNKEKINTVRAMRLANSQP